MEEAAPKPREEPTSALHAVGASQADTVKEAMSPAVVATSAPPGPNESVAPPAGNESAVPGRRARRRVILAVAAIASVLAFGGAALRARPPPPAAPMCRAETTRAIPLHVRDDRVALLPGGALVVARNATGPMQSDTRLEHDSSGVFVPLTLGDFAHADLRIEGVALGPKPALVMWLDQGAAGTLLALWQPDYPRMSGIVGTQRLYGAVKDAVAIGLGSEAVLLVVAGSVPSGPDSTAWSLRSMLFSSQPVENELDKVAADAPAVAVGSERIAVAYRSDGAIRVLFVSNRGARMGDTMTAAKVDSRPVLAFVGDALVVLWIEIARGTTRLRSATLAPGTTAFTAPRDAIDEPVVDVRPVAAPARARAADATDAAEKAPVVAWVAVAGGRQVVRASPLNHRGELVGASDLGTAAEVGSLGLASSEQGMDLAWDDGATESMHVARVTCGAR